MADISMFNRILLVSIVLLFIVSNCLAQNKVDLELTVQSAAKTVRGGEKFAYTITVTNIGSAKATDVLLVQDNPKMIAFNTYVANRGKCEIKNNNPYYTKLKCSLDTLEVGETAIISVDVKLPDSGDASITEDKDSARDVNKKPLEDFADSMTAQLINQQNSIGDVRVSAKEPEENEENNRAEILVKLLPSKNIPPRVNILSPKESETVIHLSNKSSAVTFTIQTFDPDGAIERVEVNTQQLAGIGFKGNKYVIEGKEYTFEEARADKAIYHKYFGGDAVKTGKDTYTYILENPNYGSNNVFVHVFDDGGRSASSSVRFTVKSENTIEFTNPVQNTVIKPHTDVVIETTTKFNGGKSANLQLEMSAVNSLFMTLVSQKGNVFRHQYVLKNVNRGDYNLVVILTDDSGAITNSENLYFTVAEKPTVKVEILSKQTVFKENEEIRLAVEAFNDGGALGNAKVFVNGVNEHFTWRDDDIGKHQHGYLYGLSKGTYTITAKVRDDL